MIGIIAKSCIAIVAVVFGVLIATPFVVGFTEESGIDDCIFDIMDRANDAGYEFAEKVKHKMGK